MKNRSVFIDAHLKGSLKGQYWIVLWFEPCRNSHQRRRNTTSVFSEMIHTPAAPLSWHSNVSNTCISCLWVCCCHGNNGRCPAVPNRSGYTPECWSWGGCYRRSAGVSVSFRPYLVLVWIHEESQNRPGVRHSSHLKGSFSTFMGANRKIWIVLHEFKALKYFTLNTCDRMKPWIC